MFRVGPVPLLFYFVHFGSHLFKEATKFLKNNMHDINYENVN